MAIDKAAGQANAYFFLQPGVRHVVADLGLTDYKKVWALQKGIVASKIFWPEFPDVFLITEHHHIFTLGKGGKEENLLYLPADVECLRVERGGDVTYHGPGQLVLYPIFDLKKNRMNLSQFLFLLEETAIGVLRHFGIEGKRLSINRGVFVEVRKIAFLGLSIRKHVTFHGLSINVNADLRYFSYINPCGFTGLEVTSVEKETGRKVEMKQVKAALFVELIKFFDASHPAENKSWSTGLHEETRFLALGI